MDRAALEPRRFEPRIDDRAVDLRLDLRLHLGVQRRGDEEPVGGEVLPLSERDGAGRDHHERQALGPGVRAARLALGQQDRRLGFLDVGLRRQHLQGEHGAHRGREPGALIELLLIFRGHAHSGGVLPGHLGRLALAALDEFLGRERLDQLRGDAPRLIDQRYHPRHPRSAVAQQQGHERQRRQHQQGHQQHADDEALGRDR